MGLAETAWLTESVRESFEVDFGLEKRPKMDVLRTTAAPFETAGSGRFGVAARLGLDGLAVGVDRCDASEASDASWRRSRLRVAEPEDEA